MNANEKKYVEKLKELARRLHTAVAQYKYGGHDFGNSYFDSNKSTVLELESEISALEQQIKELEDELRERKTSNTGRGHGNNFCPENCD